MWLFGLKFMNKEGEGMFPSFWWDAAAHRPEVTALAAAAPCVNHWEFVPIPRELLLVHQMGSLELSATTCLFLLTGFVQLRSAQNS